MLKIGEFSKLSRVSVRMLRHYDEIGLLKPIEIDRFTDYRYYSLRIKSQAQNEEKRGRNDEVNNKQATRRGDQKKGCVAQSSHRVKDKRLRRA